MKSKQQKINRNIVYGFGFVIFAAKIIEMIVKAPISGILIGVSIPFFIIIGVILIKREGGKENNDRS